jgi:poly(A) polymerase/tRNA nucleotidyltransferase (CCA-adding enzyme)
LEKENAITVKDLAINGNDVMKQFNLKPGPIIGDILNYLLEEILDEPEKNNRDTLLTLGASFLQKLGGMEARKGRVSAETEKK